MAYTWADTYGLMGRPPHLILAVVTWLRQRRPMHHERYVSMRSLPTVERSAPVFARCRDATVLTLNIDVEGWAHQPYGLILEVKPIDRMGVTAHLYIGHTHMVEHHASCIQSLREQLIDSCPKLTTCGGSLLFGSSREGRNYSESIQ